MKEVEVFFQTLVFVMEGERHQGFSYQITFGVTSLLNIPKLVTFMQCNWAMLPHNCEKGV